MTKVSKVCSGRTSAGPADTVSSPSRPSGGTGSSSSSGSSSKGSAFWSSRREGCGRSSRSASIGSVSTTTKRRSVISGACSASASSISGRYRMSRRSRAMTLGTPSTRVVPSTSRASVGSKYMRKTPPETCCSSSSRQRSQRSCACSSVTRQQLPSQIPVVHDVKGRPQACGRPCGKQRAGSIVADRFVLATTAVLDVTGRSDGSGPTRSRLLSTQGGEPSTALRALREDHVLPGQRVIPRSGGRICPQAGAGRVVPAAGRDGSPATPAPRPWLPLGAARSSVAMIVCRVDRSTVPAVSIFRWSGGFSV